ncbi:MAG: chaperone modulator CbpM [Chitinophagaceae bacterium]|nr:chaperone modulator CbpM [Chitinophagaceae bacterium]
MQNEELIAAQICCTHYNVEYSFISSLQQYGLLHISTIADERFIPATELQKLEKLIRLHYELDINFEGIEAISYLLDKVEHLQQDMQQMRNRLSLYEEE